MNRLAANWALKLFSPWRLAGRKSWVFDWTVTVHNIEEEKKLTARNPTTAEGNRTSR
ncbi:hypothetical protein PGTUg99_026916 [Puccinia graminis f. sp. tritici]|uniref:Uncharacterized protein n=1 Tax=Puccinia graminis f. sp. tritici TaxID=56615 RepID=A0A5B0Q1I0_PUCGR|nr:hypothetical protein PGTUg99_026916 [Puccinia graminis f. sp. tritici]